MMKRRQFVQYVGAGGLGILSLSHDRTFAALSQEASSRTSLDLNSFQFESMTLNRFGQVDHTVSHQAHYFSEDLPEHNALDMIAIASGEFWMGSSPRETQAQANEFPRHRAKVASFHMSRYPITQAQWSAIAALPRINRDLSPDPAYFLDKNRPVESVSWLDAMEFCDRLSQETGRHYQLPSEAQWEYACRAGTNTPFHTGATISSHYANYMGAYAYQQEKAGPYLQATRTPGRYPPNAFGLQEMHGNVWEWCLNRWQPNYHQVSKSGKTRSASAHGAMRAIRGGGWLDGPASVRSARRSGYIETGFNRTIGFRVVTV